MKLPQLRRPSTFRRRAVAVAVSGILAASFAVLSTVASGDPPANDLVIEALSSRADLVSGGDVLVKITYNPVGQVLPLVITLNDQTVNGKTFRPGDEPNTMVGLVTGLQLGPNVLRVRGKSSSGIEIRACSSRIIRSPVQYCRARTFNRIFAIRTSSIFPMEHTWVPQPTTIVPRHRLSSTFIRQLVGSFCRCRARKACRSTWRQRRRRTAGWFRT